MSFYETEIMNFNSVISSDSQQLQVDVNLLMLLNFLIEFIQYLIQLLIDMMFIKLKQSEMHVRKFP